MASTMTPEQKQAIENIRQRIPYFDTLFGPDGDCGSSCMFVDVNDIRLILSALPELETTA